MRFNLLVDDSERCSAQPSPAQHVSSVIDYLARAYCRARARAGRSFARWQVFFVEGKGTALRPGPWPQTSNFPPADDHHLSSSSRRRHKRRKVNSSFCCQCLLSLCVCVRVVCRLIGSSLEVVRRVTQPAKQQQQKRKKRQHKQQQTSRTTTNSLVASLDFCLLHKKQLMHFCLSLL